LSGSHHGPGLIVGTRGGSIGVKTGPQGTPCGRISGNQELTLALGVGLLAERASFDLELKGDVALELQLNTGETFIVRSGSRVVPGEGVSSNGSAPFKVTVDPAVDGTHVANCQFRADSGPDAGANDNCYVTVVPTAPFNQVAFTILSGEVSLEGSGDYENNPDFDTIFYLTRFEGELDCGDSVTRPDDPDAVVKVTVTRLQNLEGECVPKPYRLVANADDPASPTGKSVTFDLADDGQNAAYEAFITFPRELNNPTDAELQWSTEPPFELSTFGLMEVCVDEPFDGDTLNEAAIPSGEDGCIISVSQDWRGNTVWHIIFTADPNWH
jgi:hypothetical protein